MMWGYFPGWGSMLLMMVFDDILWIALLGVLVWAVIRWFERRPGGSGPREPGPLAGELPAMTILCQRYARGEIDTAMFEQMRERLEATSARERSTGVDARES